MFVLTGASGFVGSLLVPRLVQSCGERLILVSRDPGELQARNPAVTCSDYARLPMLDLRGAVFVHLAARNNDRPGTLAEYAAANVEHLLQTARIARGAGARRFINLCTTHALQPAAADLYGVTKAEGAKRLSEEWPEGAINLYIPAVYDARFRGRLRFLNALPRWSRTATIALLRQAKPVVSADVLADALLLLGQGDAAFPSESAAMLPLADPVPENGLYAFGKRCMDLSAAIAILLLLGWAMAIIALLIKADSPGPAIFAQRRVGRQGKLFTCFKFRTMRVGAREAATHEVASQWVTRVGGFLRRSKLDELPQIFNILRNEMSLVGPRPCLPLQVELIAERSSRGALDLKPGVTGLAQINDIDMREPRTLAMWDARYGAFRTLLLDVVILVRTVLGKGAGDRVLSTDGTNASDLRKEGPAT